MNNTGKKSSSDGPKRVYLLYGEESYLVREHTERLRAAVTDKSVEMLNLSVFEGKTDADVIINACDTLPFMSERRFVLVKDSGLFEAGRKDDTEKLKDYLPDIPQSTVLCFAEKKADKRNALYKAASRTGVCMELNTPDDNELAAWINKKSGKRVDMRRAMYIIRNVGTSMELLERELDKLLSAAEDTEEINEELIDSVCTKSPETNVFEMIEAVGAKQSAKALEIYNNMLRMKQSPVYVLKTMSRQFKLIMQCKYLKGKGMDAASIAGELSLRRFVADRCLRQAKNFSMASLVQALDDCARCDADFKSGRISDRLGVEVIILKYSR